MTALRLPFFLAALALTGCVSSRPPAALPPTETLAEVNAALFGQEAVVTYVDGDTERAFVEIGPELTTVHPIAQQRGRRLAPREIPTVEIESVRVGESRASSGGGSVLVLPGLALTAASVNHLGGCESGSQECITGTAGLVAGVVLTVVALGAVVISTSGSTSARGWPVYIGPVSRYPDAAAALAPRDVPDPDSSSQRP